MNCILFQKFRISEMCISVLQSLRVWLDLGQTLLKQGSRAVPLLLEVSEQDWAKLWAGSALGSAFQLGLGDPSGPFQPELSHGLACASMLLLCEICKLKSGVWASVDCSCVISPNQCRSCAVRKVGLYTVIANLSKLKRKRLIFCAISDGLCVLF